MSNHHLVTTNPHRNLYLFFIVIFIFYVYYLIYLFVFQSYPQLFKSASSSSINIYTTTLLLLSLSALKYNLGYYCFLVLICHMLLLSAFLCIFLIGFLDKLLFFCYTKHEAESFYEVPLYVVPSSETLYFNYTLFLCLLSNFLGGVYLARFNHFRSEMQNCASWLSFEFRRCCLYFKH